MQITIVGAGKLGYKLAEALSFASNHITMIDRNPTSLERADSGLDVLALEGNGVELPVLEQANVKRSDLVIAVTSSDETNMLVAMMAKKLGCKRSIARVRNPEYAQQAAFIREKMDIDFVANPELETAKAIAKFILKGNSLQMESFANGKVIMSGFSVQNLPKLENQIIRDLDLPPAMLFAAISREGDIIIPDGSVKILPQDTVYTMGSRSSIQAFVQEFGGSFRRDLAKNVLILGGGKAGFYLANKLLASNISVKIIEQDEKRCQYLAEHLKNALVIHGDGSDTSLLAEENISEMDALVALTGFDEENLLLALLGKQRGIPLVVPKVSRPNFVSVIEQLGIERAVNPVSIMASEIVRFIQGGQIVSMSMLLDGNAEALELVATEGSPIVCRPLADIDIPKGVLIGIVVRDGEVMIPNGSTTIHPKDNVVVFCMHSKVSDVEKLFNQPKGGLLGELWNRYKSFGKPSFI